MSCSYAVGSNKLYITLVDRKKLRTETNAMQADGDGANISGMGKEENTVRTIRFCGYREDGGKLNSH